MGQIGGIYFKDDEEDKKKKTPSQVAREQNNADRGQIGSIRYSSTYKPVYAQEPQVALQQPVQEVKQEPVKEEKKNVFVNLWNKVKGKKPEVTPVEIDKTTAINRELFDFSSPRTLQNSTDIAFTKLKAVASEEKERIATALNDLKSLKGKKEISEQDKAKLLDYFKESTYLIERKIGEDGKDIVKDWQYEIRGGEVYMNRGITMQKMDIKKLIPEIEESYKKNLTKLQLNEQLTNEFTGKVVANKGLFEVLSNQLRTGDLEPFVPDAVKTKNQRLFNSAIEKFNAGESLDNLTGAERIAVLDFMNEQLEDSIDRGFWSETVGSVVPSTRMGIEFALGSLVGSTVGGGTVVGILGKNALGGNVASKVKAENLKSMELLLGESENGEVFFNVASGGMGEVEANNRAYLSQGLQDLVEVGLGKVFDVIGSGVRNIGGKVAQKTIVPALSKTGLGSKVLNVAEVIAKVGNRIFNNTTMKFWLQKLGRNEFLSEVSEEVVQHVIGYAVEGEKLSLNSPEYWTKTIASVAILTGLFGSFNLAATVKEVGDRKKFLDSVKKSTGELKNFELNENGELVHTTDNTVISTPETFVEIYNTEVVDVEEEMLKADIAQAESGLVAEPVQEVKIEEGEVKTDYSQDAQVQEVLRDISLVLDAGARKKVVSKVEGSEGMGYDTEDYTYGVEGMVIPDFIPEELRSRKIVEKAYDAFLNNTVPQEGTKAWQVYQAILDESKGREGVQVQESKPTTTVFRGGKGNNWVSMDKNFASEYGEIRELQLDNSANMFEVVGDNADELASEFLKTNVVDSVSTTDLWYEPTEEFRQFLIKKGYDGFINEDNIFIANKKIISEVEVKNVKVKKSQPKTQKEQVKEGKFALKVEKLRKDAPAYITDLKVSDEAVNIAFEKLTGADIDIKDIPADLRAEVQKVLDAINNEMDKRIAEDTVLQREMEGGFTREELAGYLAMDVLEDREYEAEMQKEITPSEEDVITDDDLPFRQRELKILEDKFLDKLTVERMKEFSREWFGDENVEVVKNILRNKKALGMYLNRLIEIKNGQAHVGSTFYHEAVHKAFDIFLTADEKKAMIREVIKRVGKKNLLKWGSENGYTGEQSLDVKFRNSVVDKEYNEAKRNILPRDFGVEGYESEYSVRLLEDFGKKYGFDIESLWNKVVTVMPVEGELKRYFIDNMEDATIAQAIIKDGDINTDGSTVAIDDITDELLANAYFNIDGRFVPSMLPYSSDHTTRAKQREFRKQFGITLEDLTVGDKIIHNVFPASEELKRLNKLDLEDYNKYILPKLKEISKKGIALNETVIVRTGSLVKQTSFDEVYVDTDILKAVNRGVSADTQVVVVKTSQLTSTGNILKDQNGERFYNSDLPAYRGATSESATLDSIAQEWLAENIIDYINNRNSTTFWGKLKRMVDIFVDRVFRGIDHVKDIEDFYESLISGRLLDRQEKIEAKRIKNFNKYLTSIAGAGTKTDAVYRMEVAKEVKKLTTKILKKLEGKASVKKQFISDLTKQQDIKQVEKDIINDVLKTFPDEIDVATFEEKVLAELLPLERTNVDGGEWYEYTLSEDRGSWEYSEAIYHSPVPTMAGSVHFGGGAYDSDTDSKASEHYFGHIRIQTNWDEMVRRIPEVQNDLYQRGRIENETTESKIEVFNNQVKNIRERLNKQIKLLEATYNELKLYKTETSEQELANIQSGIAGYKRDLVQIESKYKKQIEKMMRGYKQRYKLSQYNNPSAHFRTVREEIRQAAIDGMEKILFPSGETAMHIEHLAGQGKSWVFFDEDAQGEYDKLTKDNIKVGSIIIDKDDLDGQDYLESRWVVAHVFGDTGDFIAVPAYQEVIDNNEILYNLAKKKGYYMTGEEADEMGIYSPYDLEDDVLDWDATFADKEILKLMMDINLGEQFNTSDRQEINKEHGTYLFYENTLSKYLKNNYEAKLITDKNGYTWWEVELKPEYAGAVEAFRLDELVDYRKVAEDSRIRPQVGGVLQPLITLHNITDDKLILADKAGGLIAPSVAVTKPELGLKGFGEITLVGGRQVVDPESAGNKLYSNDVYSPRVTEPKFDIDRKGLEKIIDSKKWKEAFAQMQDDDYWAEGLYTEDNPKSKLISEAGSSLGLMNLYLKEHGVEVKPVTKTETFPFMDLIDTETFKKNRDFFTKDVEAHDYPDINDNPVTRKKEKLLKQMVTELIDTEFKEKKGAERTLFIEDMYDMQLSNYKLWDMYSLRRGLEKLEKGENLRVDSWETRELLRKEVAKFETGEGNYLKWVEEMFDDILSNPYVVIGGRKLSYTAQNIVDSMFGKGVRGVEGGWSFGINRIKGIASKSYKTIEQAKRDSYGKLVDEKTYSEIVSKQYDELFEWSDKIKEKSRFAADDSTNLENSLADYARGSRSWNNFIYAFGRNGYDFDYTSEIAKELKEWADGLFTSPVPYLEGKLRRVVNIGEFDGAIIPSSYKGGEVEQILRKNGIDRIEYLPEQSRELPEKQRAKVLEEKFSDVKYRLADDTSPEAQQAELDNTVSVKLPELITMATELGANIKLQNKFRKGGKLGDFTAGEDTDSRIRILRTLFEPQGEEIMDGEGNVEKLPETPEQQMDRIHRIEKVLAHEIGHLFDWFGGENNMTLKRGNILGRIANLRSYTEGQFMDLENKDIRRELKTLTQVWNPFDEASVPKKYKTYRYSAKELYAEALSVFLNKPSLVKEVAPNFYQGFIEYMARKKEVQKEYFAIRDMIKQGNEVQSRVENMKKAQEIARGKRMTIDEEKEAYRKQSKWQEGITGIKMGFVNQYAPYLDKMRKAWKDKKITLSKLEEAEQLMGDMALKGNDAVKYAQDVQDEFFVPVSEAGIDIDTVGQILVLERNLGDRLDLANPHGLVYDYAKETYDYVKGQLSPAQWNLLSEKLSWWRDYNFELVRKGYEAGVYSEQFFNEIATVNKNTYTPFAVVDYIEDNYVTAGVIQATGTTKGVENPLTTQMLKSLSLMKLTATNGAKQDVVKSLSEIFPDEIVKADAIKDADGRTIGFKKNPKLERSGYTQLEILEDGKRTAYYMDKYIVSMFESSLNGVGWEIARFVTAPLRMVNRIFKPAVTVMKASFQFYSNPLKDYQRSLTNLTALSGLFDKSNVASRTAKVFGAFTKEWVKNLKRSWNYAGGEIDAVTQKMLDMYVLSSNVKYEDIDIGNEKFKFDPVKNRIVYKGGVNWLETLRDFGSTIPVIKHTLVPVYDFYMRAGSTFEVNSKIAGFQYLSEKVGEEKASFYTRRYVGTPDYMQKGKFTPLTNELVVFSNVGIQAITADMDLATRPKTASGYWISTMFKIVFPKLLMLLGASILRVPIPDPDDPEKKKWVNPYDYLSEYYKSMYMTFPIGYDKESESFMFVKAPSDEVGAVIGNLVWKMATYLQGEGMKVEQLGSAIAGLIPFTTGDNPLLSIGRDWMQYAQGRNPYDDFRGRLAINTSKWNEGGMTRFTEMLKWTGNEMGLTNFSTYDNSSDTTLEKTMNLPLLERMFELTNYGLQEREENDKALGKKEKNKTLDGYIESYYAEPSNKKLLELQEKYVIAIKGERPKGGWSGTEKAEETRLKSEFKREVLANSGNAQFTSIAKSGLNNDEKIKIMDTKTKNSSDSQKAEYLSQVVKYEVVKGELFAQYAKDKDLSDRVVYEVVKQSIPVLSAESNNDLLRELRQAGVLSDRSLAQLRNDGLITPAGYNKYRAIKGEEVEQQQSGRIKRPERQYF